MPSCPGWLTLRGRVWSERAKIPATAPLTLNVIGGLHSVRHRAFVHRLERDFCGTQKTQPLGTCSLGQHSLHSLTSWHVTACVAMGEACTCRLRCLPIRAVPVVTVLSSTNMPNKAVRRNMLCYTRCLTQMYLPASTGLIKLRESKAAQVCAGHIPKNPRRSDAEAAVCASVFAKGGGRLPDGVPK